LENYKSEKCSIMWLSCDMLAIIIIILKIC
jgi:hypothetical protein